MNAGLKSGGLDLIWARNEDLGSLADAPGEEIRVDEPGAHDRHHARNVIGCEEETFPFLLDTYVGNHLLKIMALTEALEVNEFDGIPSGVRWDEQEACAKETFFGPSHNPDIYPPHDRIHPILQFEERADRKAT